jgi:hypothetical protein
MHIFGILLFRISTKDVEDYTAWILKLMRPLPTCNKAQICTSLVMYSDSRNLNSFLSSLHLQQAIKCSSTVTKIRELSRRLRLHFSKALVC